MSRYFFALLIFMTTFGLCAQNLMSNEAYKDMTVSVPLSARVGGIEVYDVQLPEDNTIMADMKTDITFKVRNISDEKVTRIVGFHASSPTWQGAVCEIKLKDLAPGEERDCSLKFSLKVGEYKFRGYVEYYGSFFAIENDSTIKAIEWPNIIISNGLRYAILEDGKVSLIGTERGELAIGDVVVPDMIYSEGKEYVVTGIDNFLYRIFDRYEIKSVEIKAPITEIDDYSFIGYSSNPNFYSKLEKIILPETVKRIGNFAFKDCTSLRSINIPNNLVEIGEEAFHGCNSLTGELTIPNSVTSIGDQAFSECSGFTGNLVIPNSVISIGEQAFYNCSGFNGNLVIGDSVIGVSGTSIGESAFRGCSGFTGDLIIGDSVTSIGDWAFAECSGFTGDLVIGNSVTYIGSVAFRDCSGFTGNLIIPNSVITIESGAFNGCSGFVGNLTIPNSVTYIGRTAFMDCSGFTGNLTIPDSVTYIGRAAFRGCSGFTGDLVIGDSVTSIEEYTFYGCSGFTGDLVIGDSVTSIGEDAFYGCSGFTGDLVIGNSVTSIDAGAFSGFSFTGNLLIGNSVTTIGDAAFSGCLFTCNLVIPKSVTSIGNYAFSGCSGFTGNLVIPNSVTTIGEQAFYNCSGFTGDLIIGDSVTTIGEQAFYNCSGFTGDLVVGNSVTSIGNYAFIGCSGFTGNLALGNSVTSIGYSAFNGCSAFTGNLTIPNSVTSIGDWAFAGCSGFTGNFVIPESIISIGTCAFSGCDGFNDYWTVPELNNVSLMGSYALPPFKNVTCLHQEVPEWFSKDVVSNYPTVRVKAGFGDLYRAHENWLEYSYLYEYGDANLSKSLTVTDAVADAKHIVGAFPGDFDFDCGDINMDGEISIADVSGIINAVAEYYPSKLVANTTRMPRMTEGLLIADDFMLKDGVADVGVRMLSERSAVAMQADFNCTDDIRIENIQLSPTVAASHSMTVSRFDDLGIVRVIIYSFDNKEIDTTDGNLLTLNIIGSGSGSIYAERILCSSAEACEYVLDFEGGGNISTSAAVETDSGVRIVGGKGRVTIFNAEGQAIEIYDLAGRQIESMTADSPVISCELTSGVYIVTAGDKKTRILL